MATAALTMGAMVILPAKLEFVEAGGSITLAETKGTLPVDGNREGDGCFDEPIDQSRHPTSDKHARATHAL